MRIFALVLLVLLVLALFGSYLHKALHPPRKPMPASAKNLPPAVPPLEREPTAGKSSDDINDPRVAPSCVSLTGDSYYIVQHKMIARDANGKSLWQIEDKYPYSGNVDFRNCAVSADGTLYLSTFGDHQKLVAMSPDGKEKWRMGFDGTFNSVAVALDGTVYLRVPACGGLPVPLIAIGANGVVKWKKRFEQFACGSGAPAFVGPDGTIYVDSDTDNTTSRSRLITALRPDGTTRWSVKPEGSYGAIEGIAPNGLIIFSAPTGITAVDSSDGSIAWRSGSDTDSGYIQGITIGDDSTIYVLTKTVRAISGSGKTLWRFSNDATTHPYMDYFVSPAVLAEDGTLYVTTYLNNLYAITRDGKKRWQHIASGDTCCRAAVEPMQLSYSGVLTAGAFRYQTKSGLMRRGWPMPGHDLGHTRSAQAPKARR